MPDLPITLEAILSRALAKDPAARFQTMAEFREALLSTEAALSPPPAALVSEPLGVAVSQPESQASSFDHLGEVGEPRGLRPRLSRHGRLLLLGGAATLTLFVVASSVIRGHATRLLPRTAARRPATVRVNFGSNPTGAIIARNDGAVLGVTPLSVEIPYSDAPVEYRLYKEGYAAKVSSFVPNLPSPVLCPARAAPPPAPPLVAETSVAATSGGPSVAARPLADAPSPARARAARESRHRLSAERIRNLIDDGDDVMPPSTQ